MILLKYSLSLLDKENRRMSLSIKQLEKNPWDAISEQYEVGQKIKGKVSNVTEFGIFIQLAPGIDGLSSYFRLLMD